MPDPLIDLDLHGEPQEQLSPRYMPVAARRWIAAALTVGLLLATGAAGAKPHAGVQHVADIAVPAVATVAALDGNLYILDPGVLIALDPRTAGQLWRIQTDLDREFLQSDGDLVIVTGLEAESTLQRAPVWSMAVDVQTGEVRWRLPGNLTLTDGFVVSHENGFSRIREPGRVEVYDRAGKPLWSIASAASWSAAVDPLRKTVSTLDPATGELVEYRLDNGKVSSRVVLPELVGASIGTLEEEVFAFFPNDSTLFRVGAGSVSAQGPTAEEERADCGTLWCVEGASFKLIDKATGEVVHRGVGWDMAVHTDFGIVGVHGVYGSHPDAVTFFDPVSRRVQQLTGWSPVGLPDDSRVVRWHGPLFLLADDSPLTFFAVLDSAGIRIVGSVQQEHLPQCAATAYLVACRVSPQTVRAWHLE